jgi:hypothetical protein
MGRATTGWQSLFYSTSNSCQIRGKRERCGAFVLPTIQGSEEEITHWCGLRDRIRR